MSLWDWIPEQISPAELFYILPLLAKPKLCLVEHPRMVFKMRPWVCSSRKRQHSFPDCVLGGCNKQHLTGWQDLTSTLSSFK